MVSLQSPLSPNRRAAIPEAENPATPQKRKYLEALPNRDCAAEERQLLEKRPKPQIQNFMADIELHLETPLPSEWQRCLDIQSGKIHFYNTKTHARTSTDPRTSSAATNPDRPSPSHHDDHHHRHMSLDLELNLTTSESSSSVHRHVSSGSNYHSKANSSTSTSAVPHDRLPVESAAATGAKAGKSGTPAWLALEAERQEMVATVCMRCHMLVMLCRSSPACPNCKFVHPPQEKSPSTASFVQVKL